MTDGVQNTVHWWGELGLSIAKIVAGGMATALVVRFHRVVKWVLGLSAAISQMHVVAPYFDPKKVETHLPTKIDNIDARSIETHEIASLCNVRLDVMARWSQEFKFEAAPNGDFKQISDTFRSQFGYDIYEMVGQGWVRILYSDDRARFIDEWQWARKDNRLFQWAGRWVSKDATIYRVNVSIAPEPPNSPKRLYGIVQVVQPDLQSPPDRAKPSDSGKFARGEM